MEERKMRRISFTVTDEEYEKAKISAEKRGYLYVGRFALFTMWRFMRQYPDEEE